MSHSFLVTEKKLPILQFPRSWLCVQNNPLAFALTCITAYYSLTQTDISLVILILIYSIGNFTNLCTLAGYIKKFSISTLCQKKMGGLSYNLIPNRIVRELDSYLQGN